MRPNHHNNKNNKNNNRQRSRGRRQNNSGGNSSNRVYDSNGPDVRVRGSAQTVADKYLQLATDAQSSGDSIKAEGYFQFAEHYLRIVAANNAARAQKQAEKEKAMAEQNAKREARKAEEAAARAAADEAKTSDDAKPENDDNSQETANWEGPQPSFLKADGAVEAEKEVVEKKPKRQRRKPVVKKVKLETADDIPQDVQSDSDTQEQDAIAG